jgi:predicted ATPase
VPLGSGAEVLKSLQAVNGSATWKKNTAKLNPNGPELTHIREVVFLAHLEEIFTSLNSEIRTFSRGVRYLEPLRATAQRYYRVQELAVDEIDSKGANLAVFIHSMHSNDRDRFNEWLRTHLGFEVRSVPDGGHISLRVRFVDDKDDTNLTDTGFGMSQVLPIATQLWSSQAMRPRQGAESAPTCFVVEQPELHLHPAFQEKIADLFVASLEASVSSKRKAMRIVAETHSSSLINRLGELVAEGKIDREDVQVVMFDQTSVSEPVKIQISQFDDDGVLQNWPYGFFASGKTQ